MGLYEADHVEYGYGQLEHKALFTRNWRNTGFLLRCPVFQRASLNKPYLTSSGRELGHQLGTYC